MFIRISLLVSLLLVLKLEANPLFLNKLLAKGDTGMLVSHDPEEIHFYLYADPDDKMDKLDLQFRKKEVLDKSHFKKDKNVIFIIHGFWSDLSTEVPKFIKDAYLESKLGYNYIVVDWSILSRSKESGLKVWGAFLDKSYPLVYPKVVKNSIPVVAQRVADFIQFLVDNEYTNLDSIHIVGHSLGAHTSGMIGDLVQKKNGGKKIKRITGLDPAGPLFDSQQEQRPLDKNDAEFFDVYHSAMGTRGYNGELGHVDFYPNGGKVQPACPVESKLNDIFGAGHCAHMYIAQIYASTILGEIKACKCEPDLNEGELSSCMSACSDSVLAGEKCPPTATGHYYFAYNETLQLP